VLCAECTGSAALAARPVVRKIHAVCAAQSAKDALEALFLCRARPLVVRNYSVPQPTRLS